MYFMNSDLSVGLYDAQNSIAFYLARTANLLQRNVSGHLFESNAI